MDKKKILFVNPGQFGYKAGYYYYCKYLKENFDISLICFDQGLSKVNLSGVNIIYIPFHWNKLYRLYTWLKSIFKEIRKGNYDIIFTVFFKFSFLVGLFARNKVVLDVRTGSVKNSSIKRFLENRQIYFESLFFPRITILSKGLIDLLGFRKSKCHWVPLGAEVTGYLNGSFDQMKLLYVGCLGGRNIHETVNGFARFYKKFGNQIPISYDILGFGPISSERLILSAIQDLDLQDVVRFHGRKTHSELEPFLRKCNIGISYVPMVSYYNLQPPTKTFEYILSGMVCVATATYENQQLIRDENGVLCQDNPDSFSEALETIFLKRNQYDSREIAKTLKEYRWSDIVNGNLKPYLSSL